MKLLLEQGLPRTAVSLLGEVGIEAVHVGEIGYASAEDAEILAFGRENGFVVVTLDADFHALLALSRAAGPLSVFVLRAYVVQGSPVCCEPFSSFGVRSLNQAL